MRLENETLEWDFGMTEEWTEEWKEEWRLEEWIEEWTEEWRSEEWEEEWRSGPNWANGTDALAQISP